MSKPVSLQSVIDGMEMQFAESTSYLNKKTGEVISVTDEELRAAENEDPLDNFPEWQQEAIQVAQDVFENFDNYIELPSQYDIHEYAIMERFCLSIEYERISEELLSAIRGSGAFRRFKDAIHRLKVAEAWYRFRDQAYRQIAIDWCEQHGIEYVDSGN